MTKVSAEAMFLRWLTADGPIPVRAGIEALRTNGYDARNRWRRSRAKQEAGVVSRRNGYGPGAAFFWQLAIDDTPLPETPNTWGLCDQCRRSLWLPASVLPKPCVSTPACPGTYHPAPAMTPPLHVIERIETHIRQSRSDEPQPDLSAWRSRPSPLRTRSGRMRRRW